MALADNGDVIGSVSGGCVESELYDACADVLAGGPARVLEFGIGDEVFAPDCSAAEPSAYSSPLLPGRPRRARAPPAASGRGRPARDAAADRLGRGDGPGCADETLAELHHRPGAELILVGAVEYAVALCRLGAAAGFRVTVLDPRLVFTTKERFPYAHAVVCEWPARWLADRLWAPADALCVLSHDPKVDLPVLAAALVSPAGFVGAMGSRRTDERRRTALREAGVPADALARLRSPIGLDLGASTPEHTAIAVLAEIIAVTNAATAAPLSHLSGPIHRR